MQTECKMKTAAETESIKYAGCKMKNEDCRLGVKCGPTVNCRLGRVKRQKSTANTCKRSLT